MKIIQIPVLQDNYTYLIICEQTGKAGVLDAPDAPSVRNAVKKAGVELVAILNTHHHWDHTGGNEDLVSKQKLEVYGSYFDRDRIPALNQTLREGDQVKIGKLNFNVIEAPGHTLGHIFYEGNGVLFCGDTLFVAGCGRLFEGSPQQMLHTLEKIKKLPANTQLYCGHEYSQKNLEFALKVDPENQAVAKKYKEVVAKRLRQESTVPTTVGEELSYNPFLRAEKFDPVNPLAAFTRTREMRNDF